MASRTCSTPSPGRDRSPPTARTGRAPTRRPTCADPRFLPRKELIMAQNGALDIVVLAGGISHERDISLRSGRRVADGLNSLGHHVTVREPDASLLGFLTEQRPDVVWPALHGASGED